MRQAKAGGSRLGLPLLIPESAEATRLEPRREAAPFRTLPQHPSAPPTTHTRPGKPEAFDVRAVRRGFIQARHAEAKAMRQARLAILTLCWWSGLIPLIAHGVCLAWFA